MALPILNDYQTFDAEIPSTKQKIKYRPFLTREQKILLMALETKDPAQVLNAITNTIQACMLSPINITNLTTFDVEYLFIQLRAKSVGERANITILCGKCEEPNSLTINLNDVKIDVPSKPVNLVKINDRYTIKLRWPKYNFLLNSDAIKNEESTTEVLYEQVVGCLDTLLTDDESIRFDDEPREEVDKFLASLSMEKFEELLQFVIHMPKLKHPANFVCKSCGHDNKYTLQGITDFF